MKIEYRQLFLKDLKKLKKQPIYKQIYSLTFDILPKVKSLQDVPNVKALVGTQNRYRIRIGDYRIGLKLTMITWKYCVYFIVENFTAIFLKRSPLLNLTK